MQIMFVLGKFDKLKKGIRLTNSPSPIVTCSVFTQITYRRSGSIDWSLSSRKKQSNKNIVLDG